MAGGWATRRRLDDLGAWMAQRNANVVLRQQAEVVGRDLWDQATRDGQNLAASSYLEPTVRFRPWVVFLRSAPEGDGPRDPRWIAESREAAQIVQDIFIWLGASVLVADAQDDRWTFELVYEGHHILCRLMALYPLFVLRLYKLEGGTPFFKRPAVYAELAERFAQELANSRRFCEALWYPDQEGGPPVVADGSGASSPLAPSARARTDMLWRIQCALFLVACGGLIDAVLKVVSGDFGIALSTLIGSAILFGLAHKVVVAVWLRLRPKTSAARAGKGEPPG